MEGSAGTNSTGSAAVQARLRAIASLKGPYAPVDWASFPATPQAAFVGWLNEAIDAAGSRPAAAEAEAETPPSEPHAMVLSTVDADGRPDARVLILKNVDERGWHFACQAESPKGRQLAAEAACALTFYWPPLGRQVRVRGHARPLPADECAADFLARSAAARAGALASRQSETMDGADERNKAALAARTRAAQAQLDGNPDAVAPGWRVYAVAATDVEFWQGATDRQHGRLRYVREETAGGAGGTAAVWKKERLWP